MTEYPTNSKELIEVLKNIPAVIFVPPGMIAMHHDVDSLMDAARSLWGPKLDVDSKWFRIDESEGPVFIPDVEVTLNNNLRGLMAEWDVADADRVRLTITRAAAPRIYNVRINDVVIPLSMHVPKHSYVTGIIATFTDMDVGCAIDLGEGAHMVADPAHSQRKRPTAMDAVRGLFSFKSILNGDFGE